jgi:23S rRNA (cytidine1920-2'-O)/16S rRNA (cytidine1409-2'-O)-methyltransferase
MLVQCGLAESRSQARAILLTGQVRSGTRVIDKAGYPLDPDAELTVIDAPRFASRGGEKLEHALQSFQFDVSELRCADFGASTGGFTDVLLQHGAAHVYAVDVGYGQLAYRVRMDERVTVLDRTNARYLEELPERIDLVTIDVSFISLALVLPAAWRVLKPDGHVIALIKPQFEAGKDRVGKGGVVRDSRVHRDVLRQVLATAREIGFRSLDLSTSPITGPAGNVEFLALFTLLEGDPGDVGKLIDEAMRSIPARSST